MQHETKSFKLDHLFWQQISFKKNHVCVILKISQSQEKFPSVLGKAFVSMPGESPVYIPPSKLCQVQI